MDNQDLQKTRKILIRSVNWLGDAVMTVPAMGVVRHAFPAAEIVVAANPPVAELLAGHPFCDRVIVWHKGHSCQRPIGLLRFSLRLRREHFDLAILFQNAIEAAIMAYLAAIPQRMGYRTDGRGWLLNRGIPVGREERRLHHVDYYVRMLQKAGIDGAPGRPTLVCSQAQDRWAGEQLGGGRWAAINAGAAYGAAKRWLPERFAAAADRIHQQYDMPILLVGGPAEAAIGRQVAAQMKAPHLNLVGQTSIRQLLALLSRCRLLLTNDSGPMHMAAALGIPVVAVFGPTDHTTTSPVGDRCRIVRHEAVCAPCLKRHCPTDHRCMTAICVDEVMQAVQDLLDDAPHGQPTAAPNSGDLLSTHRPQLAVHSSLLTAHRHRKP